TVARRAGDALQRVVTQTIAAAIAAACINVARDVDVLTGLQQERAPGTATTGRRMAKWSVDQNTTATARRQRASSSNRQRAAGANRHGTTATGAAVAGHELHHGIDNRQQAVAVTTATTTTGTGHCEVIQR